MTKTIEPSLQAIISSAFKHHQAGNFTAAEALYREVLSVNHHNLNALHLLGLLMHQRHSTAEAVSLLEHAAALLEKGGNARADHAAIYNNLGNALRAAGRHEDAKISYYRGLILDPQSVELHVNLGNALRDEGGLTAAVASYRAALRFTSTHQGALMNLACILIEAGPADEALDACRQLAAAIPHDPNSQFLLGRALGQTGDSGGSILAFQQCLKLDPHHSGALYWLGVTLAKIGMTSMAVQFLEQAAALRPDDAGVHTELGNALQDIGDTIRADTCFRRVAELRPLTTWLSARRPADFSVLAVTSPGVANTPPQFLFANAAFDTHFYAMLPGTQPDEDLLRRHGDIVVNLISDADQARHILATAAAVVERIEKPILNHPRGILQTDRETVAVKLSGIDSCHVPVTVRLSRATLTSAELAQALQQHGLSFPLLLRVPGNHGGEMFEKIDDPRGVGRFLGNSEADTVYATNYADYRSADGYYRKYRFFLTDSDSLPYHLAIGEDWKVHHYTTDMHRHAWMQGEEKTFLDQPRRVFSPVHYAAMAEIRSRVGLDFFGIDCAIDHDGRLLVFEVNASVLIHDDNADFPYKTPACMRIKEAFAALLKRAATEQ